MSNYSFDKIEKNLNDLTAKLERWKEEAHNKKIGYNAKCKVCTSEHIDEIEKLREDGHTLEEIKETLDLDLSIMSLSRHFSKHYPKNKRYKTKQKILFFESIKNAYTKYPYLENYFKDKPLEYLERFNNEDGFCLDTFRLCSLLEAGTVRTCQTHIGDTLKRMVKEIDEAKEWSFGSTLNDKAINIKLNGLEDQLMCLSCKDRVTSERLDLVEKIISYNFLNIPVENKEIYFNLLNYNGSKEEFINTLSEVKEEVTPAK